MPRGLSKAQACGHCPWKLVFAHEIRSAGGPLALQGLSSLSSFRRQVHRPRCCLLHRFRMALVSFYHSYRNTCLFSVNEHTHTLMHTHSAPTQQACTRVHSHVQRCPHVPRAHRPARTRVHPRLSRSPRSPPRGVQDEAARCTTSSSTPPGRALLPRGGPASEAAPAGTGRP